MNLLDHMVAKYVKRRESLKKALTRPSEDKAFIQLQRMTKFLSKVEVKTWREAHQAAIDLENPRRDYLMEVIDDHMLDPQVRTVSQARILNAINVPSEVYDLATGERDDDASRLFDRMWFYDYLKLIIESIFYGYSPVKFSFDEGRDLAWEVKTVRCFHRDHVVPEWNAVRRDLSSNDLTHLDEPPYNRFFQLIYFGELGISLSGSRISIFKKNAINHWSRYKELCGIPGRTVKTNSKDKTVWDFLEDQLKAMGNSFSAVLPEGTDFQWHADGQSDHHNLFLSAANWANSEISKLYLGQTMTTDDGSSKSQSEVHERTKGEITKADIRLMTHVCNDQLLPLLISWGYPLEGKGIRFDMSSKLKLAESQLAIDKWISEGFEIDEEYIQETYGTRITGRKQQQAAPAPEPPAKGK